MQALESLWIPLDSKNFLVVLFRFDLVIKVFKGLPSKMITVLWYSVC
jgi:hypothetical protein